MSVLPESQSNSQGQNGQVQRALSRAFQISTKAALAPFGACTVSSLNRRVLPRDRNPQTRSIPRPLSRPRARCVTPPPFPGSDSEVEAPTSTSRRKPRAITTASQCESTFFKLSLDLRYMIYREIYQDLIAHFYLALSRRTIGPVVTTAVDGEDEGRVRRVPSWEIRGTVAGHWFYVVDHSLHPSTGKQRFLSPLLTCRQMYMEAVTVLYSTCVFSMRTPDDFMQFSTTILPQRLNTIRSLQLNYMLEPERICLCPLPDDLAWQRSWPLIADMEGLQKLHVRFSLPPPISREMLLVISAREEKYVEPMATVLHVLNYVVELPWPEAPWIKARRNGRVLPFKIVRTSVTPGVSRC